MTTATQVFTHYLGNGYSVTGVVSERAYRRLLSGEITAFEAMTFSPSPELRKYLYVKTRFKGSRYGD